MREIKFRARALNGDLIYFSLYEVTNYFPSDDVFYVGGIPCKVGSEEQHTGLKDKNGKEIYEGDIVSCHYWRDQHAKGLSFGKIQWCEGDAMFEVYWIGGVSTYGETDMLDISSHLEVIGNIYESPHLLDK